jgi:hypothetical protein
MFSRRDKGPKGTNLTRKKRRDYQSGGEIEFKSNLLKDIDIFPPSQLINTLLKMFTLDELKTVDINNKSYAIEKDNNTYKLKYNNKDINYLISNRDPSMKNNKKEIVLVSTVLLLEYINILNTLIKSESSFDDLEANREYYARLIIELNSLNKIPDDIDLSKLSDADGKMIDKLEVALHDSNKSRNLKERYLLTENVYLTMYYLIQLEYELYKQEISSKLKGFTSDNAPGHIKLILQENNPDWVNMYPYSVYMNYSMFYPSVLFKGDKEQNGEEKKVAEASATDASANSTALPPGWASTTDPSSGKAYYYKVATGETSWVLPTEAPEPAEAKVAPEPAEAKVAPEPAEAKVAPEPAEAKVAPEPAEAKVAPEPAEAKVTPQPTVAPQPAVATKPAVTPQPTVAPQPAVATKPIVAPQPTVAPEPGVENPVETRMKKALGITPIMPVATTKKSRKPGVASDGAMVSGKP